jgi:hypothetical protein
MGRGPVTAAGSEGCAAPRTYRPGRHIAAPDFRPHARRAVGRHCKVLSGGGYKSKLTFFP